LVVKADGSLSPTFTSLNEVTISRGSSAALTNIETYIDNIFLTNVQADGIILATPTGSNAASMAAGGLGVHPAGEGAEGGGGGLRKTSI